MRAESLHEDIGMLWPTGTTLSVDERMNVHLALLKIYENEDFEAVFFWGQVRGIQKDYYIAMALSFAGQYEFPAKRFFWCSSSNWTFAELPSPPPIEGEILESFNTLFTGEHDRVLLLAPEDTNEKDFTELDRLSHVVRNIENDCSVVPLGAYRMTPAHELAPNKSFKGLSLEEIPLLDKYYHFRKVQLPDKREQLEREEVLVTYDFLDSIDKDHPQGCWSITVAHNNTATLRSLLWPGYSAYHKAHSDKFGGVYIGDGIKNSDLPFMLN